MKNFSVHMRVSDVQVTDGDVNSRRSAAESLAASWGKTKNHQAILTKSAAVAEALGGDVTPPSTLGDEVQDAIQVVSPSFLYVERPLDVSVCAGMAMVALLSGKPKNSALSNTDIYGVALWSTLAFQPPLDAARRENLRNEVLEAAAEWSSASAEAARKRVEVVDLGEIQITIEDDGTASNNIQKSLTATIEALRRNATLDREELDFLWWAQTNRSRLINRPLVAIAEPLRIVAAGIEAANMLRRLPCDVHREIVLRTLDEDPALDLTELIAAIGDNRAPLVEAIERTTVEAHPAVFPLLYGLCSGDVSRLGGTVKRRVSEWGQRALLEAGFARLLCNGAFKL